MGMDIGVKMLQQSIETRLIHLQEEIDYIIGLDDRRAVAIAKCNSLETELAELAEAINVLTNGGN